jgi:hypothetical protein
VAALGPGVNLSGRRDPTATLDRVARSWPWSEIRNRLPDDALAGEVAWSGAKWSEVAGEVWRRWYR